MGYAQILMMVVTPCITAITGWIGGKYRALKAARKEDRDEHDAMRQSCVLLMGARLDALCERYDEQEGDVEPEQTQHLIETWDAYRGCGGNGVRAARVQQLTGINLDHLTAIK